MRQRRPKRFMKYLSILSLVALLSAGAVVTATASPGPRTDVKTAAYGGGGTPPKSGPCKGVGGEALQGCKANAKIQLKKALAKCAKKPAAQRPKCRKAANKKWKT
jgi:hypothetical protein